MLLALPLILSCPALITELHISGTVFNSVLSSFENGAMRFWHCLLSYPVLITELYASNTVFNSVLSSSDHRAKRFSRCLLSYPVLITDLRASGTVQVGSQPSSYDVKDKTLKVIVRQDLSFTQWTWK